MRLAGPDVNYIEASENFANLESAMEYYQAHDDEAEEIARNSYETFARRYLTPAAVSRLSIPQAAISSLYTRSSSRTGHLLLETFVLVVGLGSGLRATIVCHRRPGRQNHASNAVDSIRRQLAPGPFYYSIASHHWRASCKAIYCITEVMV